jgi:hypothetical protein
MPNSEYFSSWSCIRRSVTFETRLAMDETVEASIPAQMHQELAQYIYPKCKAIEVSGDEGGPAQTYGVLVVPGMMEQDEWQRGP